MYDINLELENEDGALLYLTATVDLYIEPAIRGSWDEEPRNEYIEVLSVWACNHELVEFVDDAEVIEKVRESLAYDFNPEDD